MEASSKRNGLHWQGMHDLDVDIHHLTISSCERVYIKYNLLVCTPFVYQFIDIFVFVNSLVVVLIVVVAYLSVKCGSSID